MGAAVAVVLMKEKHVLRAFEDAGATSPDRARPLDALRVDPDGVGMRRLRDRAVVREASPGMFYVDTEVSEAVRRTRRRIIAIVAIVAAIIALGGLGLIPWPR